MCDQHVVKMILESAQVLYCAWHTMAKEALLKFVDDYNALRDEGMALKPYKATHRMHPISVWVRASLSLPVGVRVRACHVQRVHGATQDSQDGRTFAVSISHRLPNSLERLSPRVAKEANKRVGLRDKRHTGNVLLFPALHAGRILCKG